MFLELHKRYSSWIEKKKFLCTRGYAFSPLLLPKPLFILSYHNTVQPSAQCNDHCEKNLCGIVDFAEFPAFLLHKSQAKLECPALMTRICTNPELTSFTQILQPSCFRFHRPWVFPPSFLHQYSCSSQTSPKSPKNEDALNCPGQDPRLRALPTCAIVMTPCLLL